MGTITKDTAAKIAYCYSEIEAAQGLLKVLEESVSRCETPDFRDAFGRQRGIELGVPSSNSAMRCYQIDPKLAIIILDSHIAKKQAEIQALCVTAERELGADD